jgi:integrase
MLLKDFKEQIWWPRCETKLRKITLQSYGSVWRNWIEPAFGDVDLCDITPRKLDQWLYDSEVIPGAWRVCKAMLRCAFKYELIDTDPTARVLNAPGKETSSRPTLTKEEMVTLMDGLKDTPVYSAVVCSCTLGLRREESCALMWEDFNWEVGTVKIERGIQFINGQEVIVAPKTKLSKRVLPIPEETMERLYPIRKTGRITGTLNVHQVATHYKKYCERLGLPYVPMSCLRTSWCTLMVNENKPVSKVSRYMGHADVQTTMRYYTKAREDELLQVAEGWSRPTNDKPVAPPEEATKPTEPRDEKKDAKPEAKTKAVTSTPTDTSAPTSTTTPKKSSTKRSSPQIKIGKQKVRRKIGRASV